MSTFSLLAFSQAIPPPSSTRVFAPSLAPQVITHDEAFVKTLTQALNGGSGPSTPGQFGAAFRVWREEVRPGVFHSRIERSEF